MDMATLGLMVMMWVGWYFEHKVTKHKLKALEERVDKLEMLSDTKT